ncbi:hypothetical protein L5515_011794 [Caenorhabditis briggsae]|uniref:Uncharacterized protein n=1 Tax=Caenorhabditis briggsae TaxID=6238 RepID=A0AAE9EXI0_CAEBR|nr:hypothetical protein L5515_011794 [Caenorhabditis briggsae]
MINIIGWAPDSHEPSPETSFLNQFISPFGTIESGDKNYPRVRSGHRCFTDNDYLYLIGGYTHQIRRGSIFKEIWAMSLATFEWRRYEVIGELPDTLASFAIIQVFPYSKTFILFGGSGTAFGTSSSNRFYFVGVDNNNCCVESYELKVGGDIPLPKYGHAMCAGEVRGKYYIIGGTEGTSFDFDVHALTMRANPEATTENEKYTWHCELITTNQGFPGRYRLEATYDEKNHCLLFFGGGSNEEVHGFEKIIKLDLKTKISSAVSTIPDSRNGYPQARRCHTIARRSTKVIMTGGIFHRENGLDVLVHSDVWIFEMTDYSWEKYEHSLPRAVYFHDAAITEEGCMMVFGGAHELTPTAPRNNKLYFAWFGIPRLQTFALEALRKKYPQMFSGLYSGNLQPSGVLDVFNTFCKPGKISEEERNIVQRGRIPFHEHEDRSRFFLNGNSEDYAVRIFLQHQVADPEPLQRRRGQRQQGRHEQILQNNGDIRGPLRRMFDQFLRGVGAGDENNGEGEAGEEREVNAQLRRENIDNIINEINEIIAERVDREDPQ